MLCTVSESFGPKTLIWRQPGVQPHRGDGGLPRCGFEQLRSHGPEPWENAPVQTNRVVLTPLDCTAVGSPDTASEVLPHEASPGGTGTHSSAVHFVIVQALRAFSAELFPCVAYYPVWSSFKLRQSVPAWDCHCCLWSVYSQLSLGRKRLETAS